MHIVIFTYSLCAGGAERVTVNLANYWAERGWKITIITLASRALDFYSVHPYVQRIVLDMSSESRNVSVAAMNNLKRIIVLRRILREIRPNIALGIMPTANVLLCLSAIGLRNVAVVGSEHIYPPMSPLTRSWQWLRRWTYPLTDQIIMLTREGLDWLVHCPKLK